MSKKIIIITDGAKLNDHIVNVNKAANALNGAIQVGLVSAVWQAVHGRNTNHINALALAVGKGVRKAAIGDWLLKHAPVVAETDKERAKEHPFRFSADKLADMVEAVNPKAVTAEEAMAYAEPLLAMLWTEHKPDQLTPESWDFAAALKKLLAQATGYEAKGVKVKGGELRAQLASLLPSEEPQLQL